MIVSRKDFDAERELRIKAEVRAELAEARAAAAEQMARELLAREERELERHADERRDLLDRFEPKSGSPEFPPHEQLRRMTSAEIRAQPARTRREMLLRNREAEEAAQRELQEEREKRDAPAQPALTDQEQSHLDKMLDEVLPLEN